MPWLQDAPIQMQLPIIICNASHRSVSSCSSICNASHRPGVVIARFTACCELKVPGRLCNAARSATIVIMVVVMDSRMSFFPMEAERTTLDRDNSGTC